MQKHVEKKTKNIYNSHTNVCILYPYVELELAYLGHQNQFLLIENSPEINSDQFPSNSDQFWPLYGHFEISHISAEKSITQISDFATKNQ